MGIKLKGLISLAIGFIPLVLVLMFLYDIFDHSNGKKPQITSVRYYISVSYAHYEILHENKLCHDYKSFVGDYITSKQYNRSLSDVSTAFLNDDVYGASFRAFKDEADLLPVGKNKRYHKSDAATDVILSSKSYSQYYLRRQKERFQAFEFGYCYTFPRNLPFLEKQKYNFVSFF